MLVAYSCHYCHLVLDMENTTSHQMEVLYGPNQNTIVEAKQNKRVAVQIARCTLPAPPKVGQAVCVCVALSEERLTDVTRFVLVVKNTL